MPETHFPSGIQRMIDCQIGSFKRFFGSDPASPGGLFQNKYGTMFMFTFTYKGEVVKE
jgi:hypothetical protein